MKKKTLALLLVAGISLFSGTAYAAGWNVNSRGQQVYQNDDGSVVQNSWIKINQNGQSLWYYATGDGSLKQDGWLKLQEAFYYFDGNGIMQTGWVDDDNYYCDPGSGKMITGWKQLPLPGGVTADENRKGNNGNYWFYFNQSTGEKLRSKDGRVAVKTLDNASYGFDENGILVTGWAEISDASPEIAGYVFFAEKNDNKFKMGQRLNGTWYSTVGPEGNSSKLSTGDVEWFYFKNNGHPAAGKEGVYEVQRINDKRYLFNEKGNPVYGIQKGRTASNAPEGYYYCGASKADCSVKTGKMNLVDGDGDNITCFFDQNGRGITGLKQDYLYYNGRLQRAEQGSRYQKVTLPGQNRSYVVNEAGRVMKNKNKYRDGNGNKWSVNAGGVITLDEGLESAELLSPKVTELD